MKKEKKILSPYKRKVHIDGEEWTYQIKKEYLGDKGYLKVCNPQRTKKYTITIEQLGKPSFLEDMEACPEEYTDIENLEVYSVSLTPEKVKDLIKEKIIN